jgi:hypothetical protein
MRGCASFSFARIVIGVLCTVALSCLPAWSQSPDKFSIEGTVEKAGDGCNQTVVVLCDLSSGEPLCRKTMEPFTSALGKTNDDGALDWVFASADASGRFRFTNVPRGNYVLVAQAWKSDSQPTNLLKIQSEKIHLLGRKEVELPSKEAANVHLASSSTNRIQFDQQFGNDAGFLMLSTRRQFGDPILAWFGWGTNFLSHIIGFNCMPHGKTTIHGLPNDVYASIFMNDNSPGFGSMKLPVGRTNTVRMPIVAGWSDGYKVPPTNLVWLVEVLQTNKINVDMLLGVPPRKASQTFLELERERWHFLRPIWDNEVTLPTGQTARVVDLVVANGYAQLNPKREK